LRSPRSSVDGGAEKSSRKRECSGRNRSTAKNLRTVKSGEEAARVRRAAELERRAADEERRRRREQEALCAKNGECEKRKKRGRFCLIKEERRWAENRRAAAVRSAGRDGLHHGPPRGAVIHARKRKATGRCTRIRNSDWDPLWSI
jgi:hypothetical protein